MPCRHTPALSSGGMDLSWTCHVSTRRHHRRGGHGPHTAWICYANTRRHHRRGAWSTPLPGSAMPDPCDTIVGGHGPLHRLDLPCQHSPTPLSGRMVHSNQRAFSANYTGLCRGLCRRPRNAAIGLLPPLRSNLGLATRRAAKVRWSLLPVHGFRSMKTQREAGRD